MNYQQNDNYNVSLNTIGIPMNYQTNAFPVNNQTSPTPEEIISINQSLRTNPVFVTCPGCRVKGPSKVIRNFSISSCICWFCCSPFWLCTKLRHVKELNCYDADHYCHKCGNLIGKYESL